jgi:hypothetical protein
MQYDSLECISQPKKSYKATMIQGPNRCAGSGLNLRLSLGIAVKNYAHGEERLGFMFTVEVLVFARMSLVSNLLSS